MRLVLSRPSARAFAPPAAGPRASRPNLNPNHKHASCTTKTRAQPSQAPLPTAPAPHHNTPPAAPAPPSPLPKSLSSALRKTATAIAPLVVATAALLVGGDALAATEAAQALAPSADVAAEAAAEPEIPETALFVLSAATALAVPPLLAIKREKEVAALDPPAAHALLNDPSSRARLVDIRTQAQVQQGGVAYPSDPDRVVTAPFRTVDFGGKLQKNHFFEEELLFAPGVSPSTPLIVLDQNGSLSRRVAGRVARQLGLERKVYYVEGGMSAWRAAKLPYARIDPQATLGSASESADDESGLITNYEAASADRADRNGALGALDLGGQSGEKLTKKRSGLWGGRSRSVSPGFDNGPLDTIMEEEQADDDLPNFRLSLSPIRPKLIDSLRGYTGEDLKADVLAGISIGVIALSLSMALGIASEATPAVGITTAIIGGGVISLLGGSKVSIGGPTAAFIPIVVGVAHQYGPEGLVICTALAGLMLIGMGLTGLGTLIRYIPTPIVSGFTAGIATYIFSTQVKDFAGLGVPGHLPQGEAIPAEFLEKVIYLSEHVSSAHLPSLALGTASLALILAWPQEWNKVVPRQIGAIVVATAAVAGLGGVGVDLGVETIGSHFGSGAIPSSLPPPSIPAGLFDLDKVQGLIYPSFTIALLAAIESLLCARVADGFMGNGERHEPNTELVAQGVANVASSLFGGLPATAALARTAANVRAGGRTPVAGVVHAFTVLAVILLAAPLAESVPLAALAGVLVTVALGMGEWENFWALPSWPARDAQLFLIAFTLTVLIDVAVAVEFGMALAIILFIRDVTSTLRVRAPEGPSMQMLTERALDGTYEEESIACIRVSGALLAGVGASLEEKIAAACSKPSVRALILDLTAVTALDASGLEILEEQREAIAHSGKHLLVAGLTGQPLKVMARAGFLEEVGAGNVTRSVESAILRAEGMMQGAHS